MDPVDALDALVDTFALLHLDAITYWREENARYRVEQRKLLHTRFELTTLKRQRATTDGDSLLAKMTDFFYNGLGIEWTEIQSIIFESALNACLAFIYGVQWETVKAQKLAERKLAKFYQELLISMGRRNGKTYVVSGIAATMFLFVPGIRIAIFSVSERQSKLLMKETYDKICAAFKRGTHVKEDEYKRLSKNKEIFVMLHPCGTEQLLGSYPGSSKVIKKRATEGAGGFIFTGDHRI